MDGIFNSGYPLDFPRFEKYRMFEAAGLLTLLLNSVLGITSHRQADLNREFALFLSIHFNPYRTDLQDILRYRISLPFEEFRDSLRRLLRYNWLIVAFKRAIFISAPL